VDIATAAALGHALAKNGQTAEARIILSALSERSKTAYVPPYSIAVLHAGLGENSQALDWLERGLQDRSLRPLWLKLDPRLDSLRHEARFIRLIQGMGLSSQASPGCCHFRVLRRQRRRTTAENYRNELWCFGLKESQEALDVRSPSRSKSTKLRYRLRVLNPWVSSFLCRSGKPPRLDDLARAH